MEVEYQDGDVLVVSRNPLVGRLELVGNDDDAVDLVLRREDAEELVSVLIQFLAKGEGEDTPTLRIMPKSK
ncbi:hypothetical protein ACVDG8_033305 [Mesorhizobium sp. ORM8.1]